MVCFFKVLYSVYIYIYIYICIYIYIYDFWFTRKWRRYRRAVYASQIFLGKSAIYPIDVALSVSLSVCLSVCYFGEHRSYISKIKKYIKNDVYKFWYFPSNGAISKVVLYDHDLICQGQIFQMLISRKLWEQAQKCMIRLL